MQLNTRAEVQREMGKIYRSARNGHTSPADLPKFIYALKEIRDTILMPDGNAGVAEPAAALNLNIYSVPSGMTVVDGMNLSQLHAEAQLQPLLLDHQPEPVVEMPAPMLEPEPMPEPEVAPIAEAPKQREPVDDSGVIVMKRSTIAKRWPGPMD
jgi:hypothetical protein